MIIGVTGNYCSGKDAVAAILQGKNFYHVSFSDLLRNELTTRKQKITRDKLIELGNHLRTKQGASVLSKLALQEIKDGENHVFTSIRNPSEVEHLTQREDFILVNVTAPESVRLKRIIQRNREEDPKTLKELREKESIENSNDSNSQQLQRVIDMAKITIVNDSTLEKLTEKVHKLVRDQLYKLQDSRPNWDTYFMNIAEAVKMRCTCMSAKKGAVIVKEKQIISTGYNGTPKGIEHCNAGGCKRCTSRHLGLIKSGVYSEPCICAHSEENAIVQAAHNGTSTKGATIYTTFTPCVTCSKMIINAGIKEVVSKVIYPDDDGKQLLQGADVKLRVLK
ncbi:AAA family ATPase [Candidatus Woesearchaeota archaeon]|jgi:dCMP deaminase|nr:AAA family ATPase [Candidatus Woesearchaeota archaeon]MBT5396905.1 AAA family ATPase [Candidatus Woesearchaeota archaeon]MBT5924510.1 AAA family ATPase [Candidatus Woesearchaeota archaeon]MBT6367098.1 AAA family ATPase [Candidatus Woesearchaeota archaeon]MBT7762328.1 AAA family ATPase [Candidatus Woesearchaeota archaeon]